MFYGGADAILRTAPFLYCFFCCLQARQAFFFVSPLMPQGHLLFTFDIT